MNHDQQACNTATAQGAAEPPKITLDNLEEVFTYHKPDANQLDALNAVRDASLTLARVVLNNPTRRTFSHESYQPVVNGLEAVEMLRRRIVTFVPDCRDRAKSLEHLESIANRLGYGYPSDEVLSELRLCRMWANAAIALKGLV
jgi:hypothetical protein